MLRLYVVFILFTLTAFADEHFAKLEPIDRVTIKSEANGKVIEAKSSLEGKIADGVIVKIDDRLDREDLKHSKESIKLLDKMIKLNQDNLPFLRKSFLSKRDLYRKVAPLSSTSLNQKESLYSSYIAAKSQYSATQEKILNLKNQKVSLTQKIDILKDRVSKKSISVKNRYLYSLNVKKGEYLNIGMPIATIYDISRAKLTLFLSEDELKDIDKKRIYIDGKVTNLKFSKIWKVADKRYISSYRAEIILKPFTTFSKLIKVEVK